MVDIHIWGKQSPPAGKPYFVDWLLLTPITLPPTSSALPYWTIHSLTQYLHCLQHRSSVLCWFLAAWCIQGGSNKEESPSERRVLEIPKPLNPSSAIYQQCDPEKSHKHNRSVSSNMGTVRVVFIQLLFGFNESISHKRHQALLAEIIRTVRITECLPSGRRQDSRPETATGGQHGKVLAPDKGISFSTWVLVP